jgi:hypothetical protein
VESLGDTVSLVGVARLGPEAAVGLRAAVAACLVVSKRRFHISDEEEGGCQRHQRQQRCRDNGFSSGSVLIPN